MRSHRTAITSHADALDAPDGRSSRCSRALAVTACLALMAGGMVACAKDAKTAAEAAPALADGSTSTTSQSTTVTASPVTTLTTTTTAPATTATSAPATTVPSGPGNAAGYIHATYDAWAAGDRTAAASVAEPAAVDILFRRTWAQSDAWTFGRCEGAAGSVFCVWQRPGEELLLKARNTSGGAPVNAVQFRPAA